MIIRALHPDAEDYLGFIPTFLSDDDPRPAKEQFNEAYGFAGGWRRFDGFTLNEATMGLAYPGDPELPPFAMIELGFEYIYVYRHAWVMIYNRTNGTHEVARMD